MGLSEFKEAAEAAKAKADAEKEAAGKERVGTEVRTISPQEAAQIQAQARQQLEEARAQVERQAAAQGPDHGNLRQQDIPTQVIRRPEIPKKKGFFARLFGSK